MKKKALLSTLWIFATLNYLYCDIIGLMDANLLKQYLTGTVGEMNINEVFLLGAAVLMEIPIAMVFLSRLLKSKINRWVNIGTGLIMTFVQLATLILILPTYYYLFFSVIEIATTLFIVWFAWKWKTQDYSTNNDTLNSLY